MPEQVKHRLMQRGIGNGVKITETDGTHAIGVLTAVREESFDITPKDTFQAITIRYDQVSKVQDSKSAMAKVGKGIGVAAAVYVTAIVVTFIIVVAVAAHGG